MGEAKACDIDHPCLENPNSDFFMPLVDCILNFIDIHDHIKEWCPVEVITCFADWSCPDEFERRTTGPTPETPSYAFATLVGCVEAQPGGPREGEIEEFEEYDLLDDSE